MVTVISVIGVMLGVAVLIIVISVMSGFDDMWREKILSFNSHITVTEYGGITEDYESLMSKIEKIPEVVGISPTIEGLVILQYRDRVFTPVLKGVDAERERSVSKVPESMINGEYSLVDDEAIIGRDLSVRTGARVGDTVLVYSPKNLTSADEFHLPDELEITGMYSLGMYQFDIGYIMTSLEKARELYGIEEGVHSLQVMLKSPYDAPKVAGMIQQQLGPRYDVTTWMQANRQLFEALKVEKNMMYFLLMFIILVAAFGIMNTLITVTVQKTREIGLLKALGFSELKVMGVFLWQGLIHGTFGTLFGIGLGLLALHYRNDLMHFLSTNLNMELLPKEIYFLSEIPATTSWLDIVVIAGSAMLICTIAGIVPAWQAARMDPVKALRYE